MTRASGCLVTGCTLLSLLLPAGPARAQGLDVTGSWSVRIQTTVSIGVGRPVPLTCGFQGTTTVNQAGSRFSGEIDVNQASGPGSCPSAMSATLTGDVTGNQVSMGAVMGNPSFGAASFTGTLTSAVAPGSTMSGTFTVTGGPFTGTSGTWNATKLAAVAAVPALGGWGLALLAAVLLGCSLWLLRRMSAPRPR
ncbi:MAG TPA: hypothetical protein VE075_07655 [Thermoanaerobaculia bacterium]|nr:hypothetical protein [Thermoanaerobaculia bacterium]